MYTSSESSKKSAPKSEYFAALESEECVAVLNRKADDWFNNLSTNGYINKIKKCWKYYHGIFYNDANDGHEITFGGEQGELVNLPVNHFRNIAQHMLVMVTNNKPAFQARATNTDHKSLIQANLANNLLEYYMREKKLDRVLKDAVEYAIVMGSGFIKMEWDSSKGEVYTTTDEGTPVMEGDLSFKVLSPFDVVFDSTKEHFEDNEWIITRTWVNKYNLSKKYYEHEEKIVQLKTKSDTEQFRLNRFQYDETDDVPVYEFFHKPCDSLPKGRLIIYLDKDIVVYDSLKEGHGLPYRALPIYRIAPADILGTPYGYTSMFDFLPIQDAVNSLYSVILTNQNAFGVQSILNPRGSDITVTQLMGGLNIIDYNPNLGIQGGGKPEPFQATATPTEVFNFLGILERVGETITAVNPVVRGDASAIQKLGARSGNALALIQAQSLEFMSGLQQSYVHLVEDVGTGVIIFLKDFASVPRIAAIAGKQNKTEMKEYTGDDLSNVNRVVIDVGNALSQTLGGRTQMAENLLQMYGDKLPLEQYFNVLTTGRLETLTSPMQSKANLLIKENERLVDGNTEVKAMITDNHLDHINSHGSILDDPDLRLDEELANRVVSHIEEHLNLLRQGDPDLLVALKQQPLGMGIDVAQGVPGDEMQGPKTKTGAPSNLQETSEQSGQAAAKAMMPGMPSVAKSPTGQPVLASEKGLG